VLSPRFSLEGYDGFYFSPLATHEILFGKYDVIHANHIANWGSLLAALRARVRRTPLLITPHTAGEDYGPLVRLVYPLVARSVLQSAAAVGLLSTFHRGVLVKKGMLESGRPSFILPVPVDAQFFHISRGLRPVRRGIYFGRLETHQKALDRLLPVFEGLRDSGVDFLLVGSGRYRARLESVVRERGWAHVQVEGFVPRDELHRFLATADFFLLPSRYETQPTALLEAMAAGLPIIASAIPGITEFCPRQAAIFVEQPDIPAEWIGAIRRVVEDPEGAHKMAAAARIAAMTHHPRLVAKAYLKVYEALVGRRTQVHAMGS
jgi:rhamnosyl/mannosyltransferase